MNARVGYRVAIVVSLLGLMLAFSPHVVHHALGFAQDDHVTYVYVGLGLYVAGTVGLFFFGKKA